MGLKSTLPQVAFYYSAANGRLVVLHLMANAPRRANYSLKRTAAMSRGTIMRYAAAAA